MKTGADSVVRFSCSILQKALRPAAVWPVRVVRFYAEGFRAMTLGRTLWIIVLIKLFIMFALLKPFFFADPLAGKDGRQRAACVLEELTLNK